MSPNKELVIVSGARTAMVDYVGDFSKVSATDLGAHAVKEAVARSGFKPKDIDHVFMGNALQTANDAIYGARHVALKAGLPVETPALTVNRICGSGIQSIVTAAQHLLLDEGEVMVAGGMENMTQAPYVIHGARKGFGLGQGKMKDLLWEALTDTYCGFAMAQTAENLAIDLKISRKDQDEFALRSQLCAAKAIEAGHFKEEIAPYEIKSRKGSKMVDTDTHPRPGSTLEALEKLPAYFSKDGFVTAGNASGIVDGGAAVVLTTAEKAKAQGSTVLGKILSWGVAGVEPRIMGIGPVPSSKIALEKLGMSVKDLDLVEVNEAFAAQYLAVERELGLDRDKVNVNGGAIALGHPLGMTGTRLVHTLMLELKRRGGGRGLATACIGGGQGIALIVEVDG